MRAERVLIKRLMKKGRIISTSLIIVFLAAYACEEESLYDPQRMLECYNARNWDAQVIKEEVVGTWEWKYMWCCGEADPDENDTKSKGLIIVFKADGSAVLTDPVASRDFTWSIQAQNDYYLFETDPFVTQLAGQILFCNKIMLCKDSDRDGADNYFSRSE